MALNDPALTDWMHISPSIAEGQSDFVITGRMQAGRRKA